MGKPVVVPVVTVAGGGHGHVVEAGVALGLTNGLGNPVVVSVVGTVGTGFQLGWTNGFGKPAVVPVVGTVRGGQETMAGVVLGLGWTNGLG